MTSTLILNLLLQLATLAPTTPAPPTSEAVVKSKRIELHSFPSDSWDGKTLEYVVVVKFPDTKGKPKAEAERIRKYYVVNGVKQGVDLLFRLASFDPGHFHVEFIGNCQGLKAFPPKRWQMTELFAKDASDRCADIRSRVGDEADKSEINGAAWVSPEQDIALRSFQAMQKFSKLLAQGVLDSGIKKSKFTQPNSNSLVGGDAGSFLTQMDGETGQSVNVLVYSPSLEQIGNGPRDAGVTTYIPPYPKTVMFSDSADVASDFSVNYQIPSLALWAATNKGGLMFAVPNQRLAKIFQASAPNVSPAFLEKVDSAISKKLEPFGLALGEGGAEGGSSLGNIIQGEINNAQNDDDGNPKFPTWLSQVKIETGKEVWSYLLLHSAKIEAEKSPDNKIVLFKFTVNMSDLLKSAKAVKYEKFISQ